MECLICKSSKPVLMQSSRVLSFRDASKQYNDDLHETLDEDATSFMCHKNCISTYCSKEHIKRHLRKRKIEDSSAGPSVSPKHLRRSSEFSFLEHCLFCGKACNLERPLKNRWKKAYLCRTADRRGKILFKQAILRHAQKRDDDWGNDVSFRFISALSDLHAAEACYHKDCMSDCTASKEMNLLID